MVARLHPHEPPEDEGIYGLPYGPEESLIHLLPVPFEATTSYGGGTRLGPRSILEESSQLDLLDPDCGHPYRVGIHCHPEDPEIVAWDETARAAAAVARSRGASEAERQKARAEVNRLGALLDERVEERIGELIDQGRIAGMIGGDHATAFGSIAAHARRWPGLGVLHLDAHADLRRAYEGFTHSHASIMGRVIDELPEVSRLVQIGLRDFCREEMDTIRRAPERISAWTDQRIQREKLGGVAFGRIASQMVDALPRLVYLSWDIDGLDPSLCPHTGTPVPGGLFFPEAVALLRAVLESGRIIVGFDLVEVSPGSSDSTWDGNVGARLLYKMIGFTLLSRQVGITPGED